MYLLDHSKQIKMKTLTVESLYNYELKDPKISESTENTYIAFYKAWINNIFPKYQNETSLNWVIKNQNHVLYKLMEYRSDNKQSLETLRKDLNLMLKLIKLSFSSHSCISISLIVSAFNKNLLSILFSYKIKPKEDASTGIFANVLHNPLLAESYEKMDKEVIEWDWVKEK